jgi:hypothetical protein
MATKRFTIDCELPERWVNDFCSFLKQLERNGKIGHSSLIGFYADGDGDFRPKFSINVDYTETEGRGTSRTPEVMYDAG